MPTPVRRQRDPGWPDSLDALAAAPANHRLLLENEHARVLETVIPPGARTPAHTHRWPSVQYLCSWSDFLRRDHDGKVVLDTRALPAPQLGAALWSEPLPLHSVENIGAAELRVVVVEIKPTHLPDL
ncbi:MAG: hypothetical protein ACRD3A_10265 [Terriglobales bacterium]